MLVPLLLGSVMIIVNMGVQVFALVLLIRYFQRSVVTETNVPTVAGDVRIISVVLLVLFAGHIVQFATWALLFVTLGEFSDFATAFYHSTVNFAALGYGDIVMSAKWRLLGGLEAANGVLMFGLTAGTLLTAMDRVFSRHNPAGKRKQKNSR